ncbi:Ig-like domain-containing protein [Scandinavium manionii]|uniref:Ig-like domain-containing protein n=1 Tax=Scandinavium manionii TaxID=2926520 RepID=UPI00216515AF|nr:Ig-like domain-containing protein [Scandinavium manionii]MCS2164212.1 Ig-like domain-containing protein [Scandinavium manionii]
MRIIKSQLLNKIIAVGCVFLQLIPYVSSLSLIVSGQSQAGESFLLHKDVAEPSVKEKPFEKQLANGAVAIGTTLSDEDRTSSEALSDFARSQATNAVNSSAETWLNQFGTASVQLSLEEHGKLGNSSADWLVPLYDSPKNMLFTQLGMRHKDDRNTINVGIGSRFFLADNWMFGLNSFIDSDITGRNYRLGIGVEAWGDYLKLSGNTYTRLSGWHQSRDFDDYDERPANGFDIRINGFFPALPQLGGTLAYEQYLGDDVALFGKDNLQKDPYAVTVGANYTPVPMLTFSAEQRMGKGDQSELNLALNLTWQLDKSLRENLSPDAVDGMRKLSHSRYDLVERNNNIVLEYRKQQVIRLSLSPENITGAGGSMQTLTAVVTAKNGLRNIQWQGASFTAAGGKVVKLDATHYRLTLPLWQVAQTAQTTKSAAQAESDTNRLLNTYVLTAVAEDSKGNRSLTDQVTVQVTPPVAQFMGDASVEGDYAPPDGVTPIKVLYRIVDGKNNAVMGENVEISVTYADGTTGMQSVQSDKNGDAPLPLTSTVAGETRLVAQLSGGDNSVTTVHYTDSHPDAAHSSLNATPAILVADGKAQSTLTLTLQDSLSRPVSGLENVSFALSGVSGTTLSAVQEAQAGEYVATLSGITAGEVTVTPTLDGKPMSGLSTHLTLTSDKNSAHISSGDMTVVTNNALADGTSQNRISVSITDVQGNPVAGQTVNFSANNGATLASTGTTDDKGTINLPVTSFTAGVSTVTATVNGQTEQVDVTFTADSQSAQIASGDLSALTDNARADGVAENQITVKVTDAQGNTLPNVTVNFTASNGAKIASTAITDPEGTLQLPVTSVVAGISQIVASVNGSSQAIDLTFTADSSTATIASGDLQAITNNALANGVQANRIQVKVTDANGNPLPAQSVNFTASNGAAVSATGNTNTDGVIEMPITSQTAGNSTLTATVNGQSQSVELTFNADASTAEIAQGALVVLNDQALADGKAENQVQVTVTDANGNVLPGQAVTFSASNGATIAASGESDSNGKVVLPVTSLIAGVSTINATVNNSQQTVDVTFIADESTATIATGALTVTNDNALANGSAANQIQVIVTDAGGNALAGQTVSFSATNGAVIAASTTTDGSGRAQLPVTSKTAGVSTVQATVGNSSQTVEVHFEADASTAQIAGGALTVVDDNALANGDAVNRIAVQVTDASGNPLADQDVSFTANNGARIASSGTTGSDGTVQLTLTSTTAGVSTVTASVNGSSQSVDLTFIPDSSSAQISTLAVKTDNAVADGNAQNEIQISVTDANNNPLADQTVNFTATAGAQINASGKTTADGTLSMGVTSLTAGSSTVTASVNGKSQNVTITFVADSTTAEIASGNMTVMINGAKADNVATNVVRVAVSDANGNPLADQQVSFTADNGAVIAAQGTTNAAGVIEQSITSTQAGDSHITATVNGSQQSVTVTFKADGDSAHIAAGSLTTTADNAVANGSAANQVQATVVDEHDNPVPGVTARFSATNGATIDAQGTTDASGHVSASLTSQTAGVSTVTATLNGGNQTVDVTFMADSSTATVHADNLTVITDNALANGLAANQVQVMVTDANGNPVAGENVDFTASNGATVASSGTTGEDGSLIVSITSLKAVKSTIQVTVNTTTLTTEVTFKADASTAQIADGQLSIVNSNATANGSDANSVRVQVTDKNGNSVGGQIVSFTATNNATIGATGTTDASGSLIMPVTSLTAGVSTVTASVNSSSQHIDVLFVADGSSAQIVAGDMTVMADNALANGQANNEVQVRITDANGNPLANQTVSFSASNGAAIDASATTDAEGRVTQALTNQIAGQSTVTATVNGSSQTATVTFVADSGTAQIAAGALTVISDNAVANGVDTNEIEVHVTDANGNALAGQSVTFSASNSATIAASAVATDDGTVRVPVTSLKADSSTLTATVNGSSQNVDVTFVADSNTAQIASGDLSIVTDNALANGTAVNQVQVWVSDAHGNPVPGQAVSFTASNGATIAASGESGADGNVVMDVTSATAGVSTLTASVNGSQQSVDLTFSADTDSAQIAQGDMSVVSNDAVADGTQTNSVKVRVTDAQGNPLAGQTVQFAVDNGATHDTPGVTGGNGELTLTIANTTAGITHVTASINGSSQNVSVNFIADSSTAAIAAGEMTLLNDKAVANGSDPDTVQVIVKDANGNPVAEQVVSFTADNNAQVAASGTTNTQGVVTVPVTSIHAGISRVTAILNGSTQNVDATFIADSSTAQILASDMIVTANNALSDGKAQNLVQVTVTDANGNVVGAVAVTFSATNGAVVTTSAPTDASGVAIVPVTTVQPGTSEVSASINGSSQNVEMTFIPSTVPVITDVEDNAGSVTGLLTSGMVTDDTSPRLSGTADSNATIRLFDNGTQVASGTANADGLWSLTPDDALSGEGDHTLTVTGALTADGPQSPVSGAFILNLDTVAQAPVIERVTDSSGEVALNGTTNGDSVNLFGTSEPEATVSVYVVQMADRIQVPLGSVEADNSGSWKIAITDTRMFQATGEYHFQAKITDKAGNTSKTSDMDPYVVNYQSWPAPQGTPEYTIKESGEVVSQSQVESLLSSTGNALFNVVASGGYNPTLALPVASAANSGNRVYISVGSNVVLGLKNNGVLVNTLSADSNSTWYSNGTNWKQIY